MPLAPAIGAALQLGLPARTKGLYIGGLDVLGKPGLTYGVLGSSILLRERGPGDVSELTFQLSDPLNVLTLSKSLPVTFMDITRNVPLFTGFVDRFPYVANGLGRTYTVECVGIEAVLDWMKVPPMTFAGSSDAYGAIAALVANATGIGVSLKVGWSPTGTSSLALPFILTTPQAPMEALTTAGGTLRDAINQVIAACNAYLITNFGFVTGDWRVTVDAYGGLRSWDLTNQWAADAPSDWLTLVVAGPTRYPAGTELDTVGAEVRGVYIQGGNAAGTGVVMDSTGLPGEIAYITDATILTDSMRKAVAQRYLAANSGTASGTVTLEENSNIGSVGNEVHAGGKVTITDATLGLSAYAARISEIGKTYLENGAEVWDLSFGKPPPSAADYMRQLTRSTQS